MKTSVIIPAAGLGTRIGGEKPKQFLELNGIPILIKTIKLFDNIEEVESIIVPVHSEWHTYTKELVEKFDCKKVKEVTIGGKRRQESIHSNLNLPQIQESELILIHDAVRPFASQKLIRKLIEEAEEYGAVIPAIKPNDTIKEKNNKGFITKTLDRNKLVQVQTPQVYWKEIVIDAYEKAGNSGYDGTDSAALVEFAGYKVFAIEGEETNFKITSKMDLEFAEFLAKKS
jgi:2-C-methyl-D-erythritol 4-phosphate cytidylyltransferase